VAFAAVGWRLAGLRRDGQPAVRATAVACLAALSFLPAACMVWPYTTNAGLPQTLLAIGGAAAGVVAHRTAATRA
jgi:hypothetical protein